jgi:hypothetical protein
MTEATVHRYGRQRAFDDIPAIRSFQTGVSVPISGDGCKRPVISLILIET